MDLPVKLRKKTGTHTGSVLVLVLIVMSTLIILSVGLAYRTRIEMRLAYANAQRIQAYYLALGGIERVKALLNQEKLEPATITRICRFTGEAVEEELFEQFPEFAEAEREWIHYSLCDELGYLSVNQSDPGGWENLDCMNRELKAAILDWIDKDDQISSDGAETDFYQRIEPPYVCKNSDCTALKELRFLRGVSLELYIGEDIDRDSILDDNERDGQLKMPPDNEDARLDLGLVDVFTIFGEGKVNINTVSGPILASLPGLDEDAASFVLAYRAGPDGQLGTEDDICFKNAQDIAGIEGLTELQLELLGQYCTFDSQYFRIFSSGGVGENTQCCLMATVKHVKSKFQVLFLERLL